LQTTPPLVSLSHAGIKRAGRWLVRGVDLVVNSGEIVTLIGPNGSGKSTSAKMALGVMRPDEGKAERHAGLRIGYVPQKVVVDWTLPLTVERFMGLTAKVPPDVVASSLESTGVAHLRKAEVRVLSGGEFQRVMLARALARRPELLVLDEPVQGVDFSGETALYELIRTIRDQLHCGILLISHDLHVVMAATDRVICLNGHVCCQGTPSVVAASPEYRSLFGERGAAAIAVYRHQHDHTHLQDGRIRRTDSSITDHPHHDAEHHHDGGREGGPAEDKASHA